MIRVESGANGGASSDCSDVTFKTIEMSLATPIR